MGVSALETVCSRLIDHGRAASTPFALIENGTRTNQRVVTGSLSELVVRARAHGVRAPALLVIGEVAALATTWAGSVPTRRRRRRRGQGAEPGHGALSPRGWFPAPASPGEVGNRLPGGDQAPAWRTGGPPDG